MEEWLDKVMVERTCPDCQGARLRPEYLAVRLNGYNIHQLSQMPLWELERVASSLAVPAGRERLLAGSLETLQRRLRFLTA